MRRPSPFTPAERELIAAYVSGVNACHYCHGVHTRTAEAFGIAPGVLEAALADLDTAPVGDRSRPQLRLLTRNNVPFVLIDRSITGFDCDLVQGDSVAGDLKISETVDLPHWLVSMTLPRGIFEDGQSS